MGYTADKTVIVNGNTEKVKPSSRDIVKTKIWGNRSSVQGGEELVMLIWKARTEAFEDSTSRGGHGLTACNPFTSGLGTDTSL